MRKTAGLVFRGNLRLRSQDIGTHIRSCKMPVIICTHADINTSILL